MDSTSPPNITIRSALPSDIPFLTKILTYYILNTTTNFSHLPPSTSLLSSTLTRLSSLHLPFLVAVASSPSSCPTTSSSTNSTSEASETSQILGYTLASPYSPLKIGYSHTLELSIYLSPTAPRASSIGTLLLTSLVHHLRNNLYISTSEGVQQECKCHTLLAIMSVDPDEGLDEKVKRFYEKNGFEEVGRLREVGWKRDVEGREGWRDVRILGRVVDGEWKSRDVEAVDGSDRCV